jgi:hypothetical protein
VDDYVINLKTKLANVAIDDSATIQSLHKLASMSTINNNEKYWQSTDTGGAVRISNLKIS